MEIIDITKDNVLEYGLCGYKSLKKPGYPEKISWLKQNTPLGLKIKALISQDDGLQGMIEYIPGEYCWRPVNAEGYLFIHCLFVGFKKQYKGKGHGATLIDSCIEDARKDEKKGVAVVTRKGSFMAGNEIFLKKGFEIVDTAYPDFELLIKSFQSHSHYPKFKEEVKEGKQKYDKGLTIMRADQCPYTVKNVQEISETAEKEFGISPKIVELTNYKEAQKSPCPFAIFCIIYKGRIISHHPISKRRFSNIMSTLINKEPTL
jgi:hypothetical protein